MDPEYRLTYFDIEGLAEPLRLLFVLARVPFKDVRVPCTPGKVGQIPSNIMERLPYGQMPILEFEDMILSQSAAIGRFLAKKFNFYGSNEVEAAKIDEIIEAFRDYGDSFRSLRLANDEETKAQALKYIVEVSTPKYGNRFCKILEKNGTGFFVGSSPTFADLLVYHFMIQFNLQIPGLTQNYPTLENFIRTVGSIPEIREWNQKKTIKTLVTDQS